MNLRAIVFSFIITLTAQAEVGRILQIKGKDAHLLRQGKKTPINISSGIEHGDEIITSRARLLLVLNPSIQISLSPNSKLTVVEHAVDKSKKRENVRVGLKFLSGSGRFLLNNDKNLNDVELKLDTEAVVFTIRGEEFEGVLQNSKGIRMDVIKGLAEASSPFVQSFVPEIIKAGEAIIFDQKKKAFQKKKYSPQFKGFLNFQDLKSIPSKT